MIHPSITVLSHVTSDVSQPALYLTAQKGQKYLIGRIGEGLQRSMSQHRIKTMKLSGIFVSGNLTWKTVSGLPGLLLSFGDRGLDLKKLYISSQLLAKGNEITQSYNHFKFHKTLQSQFSGDVFEDENLTIKSFCFDRSTSFLVQMKGVRGKFDVQKAIELNVPKGEMFGKLSNGIPVTLESGLKVLPEDVMGPMPTPVRVLVLDLPTNRAISECLNNLDELLLGDYDLRAVYIFVDNDSHLVNELIERFNTKVFLSVPKYSPNFNTMTDFERFQSKFRLEFAQNFTNLTSLDAPKWPFKCQRLNLLHTLSLIPNQPTSKKVKHELENEGMPLGEVVLPSKLSLDDDLDIITLGTGASAPSKYRNVSGTLVRFPEFSVLFDCGEATYNFMERLYGRDQSIQILRNLKIIYISHMHADHHLGALQMIQKWLEVCNEKLVVACPFPFIKFVEVWAQLDNIDIGRIEFVDLDDVCVGDRYKETSSNSGEVLQKYGVMLKTCMARHNCQFSYNVALQTNKFKVSYSGDTKPNNFFAHVVGINSDLLIHEATHANELEEMAWQKGHSTINNALQIGMEMRAKNIVLTHISQKYPKLPSIGNDFGGGHAYFGFDGMKVNLSEIGKLQEMIPRMGVLLEEAESDSE